MRKRFSDLKIINLLQAIEVKISECISAKEACQSLRI